MRKVFFIFFILLSGCEEMSRRPALLTGSGAGSGLRSDIRVHVNAFYTRAAQAGRKNLRKDVEYVFDYSMPMKWAGTCTYGSPLKVSINPYNWNKYDTAWRESLIFHELGHCVLGRGHRPIYNSKGRALSIMNGTGIPYSDEYVAYYDE